MVTRTTALTAAGVLLICLSPFSLRAAATRPLPGHVPGLVAKLKPIGRANPTDRLSLAIGLPLRNREALTNLLESLYDPSSPQYRKYLTAETFTDLFGPSTEDYQTVTDFARVNGFAVSATHPNRLLLDVNASVGDIERALHTTIGVYQHPTEGRTFYAPLSEPSVDAAVPILDISGLSDLHLPKPQSHKTVTPPSKIRPLYGSGPGGLYRGNDFRAAYAPNIAATGSGQALGLVEFDGYYASDITSYESQSGVPNIPLTNVLLDNFNGTPGSANIEVALDIEVAIAMAPGLSRVIVYQAGPRGIPNDVLNRMATDNTAKQLSSSWTWSGNPSGTTDSIFQQMAAQGQSFFQASGDSDAYTGAISQPADNPYITVVGGTSLTTSGPAGAWLSETTWNWATTGSGTNGSSGGISTTYAIPAWQQGISMSANQGSTTMRNIPDVALTADSIWVTYDNGSSGGVGGTSCAAPLWAGVTALINQQAAGNGKGPVGFINPAIYSLAKSASYSTTFHDIKTGNNTNSASPARFYAVSGLDLCTGWGTPSSGLVNVLAGTAAPQIVSNGVSLVSETCSNNVVDAGETVTLAFSLINTGSASTTNLVATLLASGGVTSPGAVQTYGVVAAAGPAVQRPFTFTATGTCGGVIIATLQLQDNSFSLGTVNFAIRLGTQATVIALAEGFDSAATPALPTSWTTEVLSGLNSAWTTTNGFSDSGVASTFTPDTTTAGETVLLSPTFAVNSSSAKLTFRHDYNLALRTVQHPKSTTYYDGGVLEISIGGGAFTGIVAAGGSFSAGGYNCTLATGTGNPLAGSPAWGGNSGGWVTTTVVLPATAAGQNVQLRWACGTGINPSAGTGWFVDSIALQDTAYQCCSASAPTIATQPTNQVVLAGNKATFTVSASGGTPLTYRWAFNGTPLAGATAATLALSNVELNQAGGYAVVVSNAVGAVTSALATLTVLVPPAITQISPSASGATVALSTLSGISYQLEYKNSLSDPTWTPVSPWVPGTGGALVLQDTNAPSPTRFYRVDTR
jgi:hypothetical protein